jgi:hypothetical protein
MSSKSLENEFTNLFIKRKRKTFILFSFFGFGPLAQPAAPPFLPQA